VKSKAVVRKGISEATVKSHMEHLMAALRGAHKLGMLVEVPKIDATRRAKKSNSTSPMKGPPITAEEFERMSQAVPKVVGDLAAKA